jgi:hypothetical protein
LAEIMIHKKVAAVFLAAIFAATELTLTAAASAGSKFDGSWSVVVFTRSGPCDPSFRFSGQIVNGQISYAYNALDVTGAVADSGETHVHVTAGDNHGEAHGHMSVTQGAGVWSGVGPDGRCEGTWIATRAGTS